MMMLCSFTITLMKQHGLEGTFKDNSLMDQQKSQVFYLILRLRKFGQTQWLTIIAQEPDAGQAL